MKNDYYNLLHTVYHLGQEVETRGLRTKELTGVKLVVSDYNFFATPIHRPFEDVWKYCKAELCWYLSGNRDITNILPYSKFWGNIRNADNTVNSNYGDLVFFRKNSHGISSFGWAMKQLMEDKLTRKALILYNDRELFYDDNNDLICNQYQHFLIRGNELICFVAIRSSDAIMGLQYNIPWWSFVHQQLFIHLKCKYPELKLGKIEAFISSSHIYKNKYELVEKILQSPQEKYFMHWKCILPMGESFEWYMENLERFLEIERINPISEKSSKL